MTIVEPGRTNCVGSVQKSMATQHQQHHQVQTTTMTSGNGMMASLDSNSSTGYQDSPSEDDGYFTSAVSVQHKTSRGENQQSSQTATSMEASSSSTCSTMETSNFKKVVWPNVNPDQVSASHQNGSNGVHHHNDLFQSEAGIASTNGNVTGIDKPMAWVKNAAASSEHQARSAAEALEMEIEKRRWDATNGRRLSRSRSRSRNIMERARSFERAAAEASGSQPGSRVPSRQGSFSNVPGQFRGRQRRSPSTGRSQLAESWNKSAEENAAGSRPPSRAAREKSVGRIDTTKWEAAMAAAAEQAPPPKTPPVKRRQLKAPSPAPPAEDDVRSFEQLRFPSRITASQGGAPTSSWPPQAQQDQYHEQPPPPPPPPRDYITRPEDQLPQPPTSTELNTDSIQSLSRQDKDQIVEQWVRQTSTQQARDELEQFALEIAESVVSTMERNNGKSQKPHESATSSSSNTMQNSAKSYAKSTASTLQERSANQQIENERQYQKFWDQRLSVWAQGAPLGDMIGGEGTRPTRPTSTYIPTERPLSRGRRYSSSPDFEKHDCCVHCPRHKEDQHQMFTGVVHAKPAKVQHRDLGNQNLAKEAVVEGEEDLKRRRLEESRMRKKQIEEKRRMEEQIRQEESARMERLRQEEDERMRQEAKKYADQKRRFEEEKRKLHEEQMRLEEMEMEQQQQQQQLSSHQGARQRSQTPSFGRGMLEPNQVSSGFKKSDSHFVQVRTGQVNEKRNFWMKSTEHLNRAHEPTSGPRRTTRRLGGQDWIRGGGQDGGRPGSSLGQPIDQGAVRNTVSGWGAELSKSKSSAAVLQQQARRMGAGAVRAISKERELQQQQHDLGDKHNIMQEVNTNQVQEAVDRFGRKVTEVTAPPPPSGGRSTPLPSRNIGEAFADVTDNYDEPPPVMPQRPKDKKTPWRTKTPEPALKLVNVAVEKPGQPEQSQQTQQQQQVTANTANVRFANNAEAQMASHIKQTTASTSSTSSYVQQTQTQHQQMTSSTVTSSSSSSMLQEATRFGAQGMPPKSPGLSRKSPGPGKHEKGKNRLPAATAPGASAAAPQQPQQIAGDQAPIPFTSSGPVQMPTATMMTASATSEQTQTSTSATTTNLLNSDQKTALPNANINNNSPLKATASDLPVLSGWLSEGRHEHKQQVKQHQQFHSQQIQKQSKQQTQSFQQQQHQQQYYHEQREVRQEFQQQQQVEQRQRQEAQRTQIKMERMQQQLELQHQFEDSILSSPPPPKEEEVEAKAAPTIQKPARQTKEGLRFDSSGGAFESGTAAESLGEEEMGVNKVVMTDEQINEQKIIEDAMKGKVRENIAVFQQQPQHARSSRSSKDKEVSSEDELGLKGKIRDTKQAFAKRTSSTEREDAAKIQRAQELEVVAQVGRQQRQTVNEEEEQHLKQKDLEHLEARARMLQEVASLRSEIEPVDDDGICTSQEKAAERARSERNRELAEIAEMRNRTNWDSVVGGHDQQRQSGRTPDPELEEARKTIRNTASKWQEREANFGKRIGTPPSGRTTPSRRIGNLFNRDSEHWKMDSGAGGDADIEDDDDDDEPLPAPPSAEDIAENSNNVMSDAYQPLPPPRDSSKDFMLEYSINGNKNNNVNNNVRAGWRNP